MAKLFFALFILTFSHLIWASFKICPGIINHGDNLNLTKSERLAVCGDEKLKAYEKIPIYQARFFLKGFLQSRGYLSPHFFIKNHVLHIYPGEQKKLKKISLTHHPNLEDKISSLIEDDLQKAYKNKTLTPKLLDKIEETTLQELSYQGFPCAKVSSEAFVENQQVRVQLDRLKKYRFGKLEKEKIEGLHTRAFDRYYAFDSNDFFDERLLELTQKRMTRSLVVQGTYFLRECGENELGLEQKFITGPPRSIRYGMGASSELGAFVRLRWAHNRYKSMASVLSAFAQASIRFQTLTLSADSFLWNHTPRRSLLGQLEFIRESQLTYEQSLLRVRPHLKWTRDSEGFHKTYTLGPSYETGYYSSQEKSSTRSYATGAFEGGVLWTSHTYEFFDFHPHEGEIFQVHFDFRHPSWGFNTPLLKINTSFLQLGKLSHWGRGGLIGGIRLNAGVTWVRNEAFLRDLPPTVKFFGGGSDDVRGFNLNTLPENQGLGALTKMNLKLELRRTSFIKESVEAFLFTDIASFGMRSWEIDPTLFYSPGLGLRWRSPIGLVQSYVARSFKERPFEDKGYFLFAGIGGTF